MIAARWLVAFGLVVGLTLSAASGPLEDGIAAYDREDYATALRIFRTLAEQDDHTAAHYFLGRLYQAGKGVPEDLTQSTDWYLKAADRGHVEAMMALGVIYSSDGPQRNFIEALKWFNIVVAVSAADDKTRKRAEEAQIHVSGRMNPSHIVAAQRLAEAWKPRQQ